MSKIKIMDDNLANKIAAGEVVESPLNVVKELVENSIDAQSDEITINLIDSGIKQIEVIDNGIGMDNEDAKKAFERHATSKIKNIDDLFYITSLGFRGEALPSISSISKVSLKTSDGKQGTKIVINGGILEKNESIPLIKGTTIKVKELFYNTPVRLKYLKNIYRELANILDYLNKMALSYPNIKFKVTNNNNTLLETSGNKDLLKVIYNIYGSEVTKKMIEISKENDDYNISGYISYPEVTRSTKNAITILVNNRVIKNNNIIKTITESYHTYIHKGRYPIVVLNIDVDPILIDVNIHPTKMDIKFSKWEELSNLIKSAIEEQLKIINLIPDINVRNTSTINDIYNQIHLVKTKEDYLEEEIYIEKTYEEIKLNFNIKEEEERYHEERIKPMTVIGNIFKTYILCVNEEGFFLVDQHAAAERINYEKYIKQNKEEKSLTIELLTPYKYEFTKSEFLKIKNNLSLIKELKIDIEEFGDNIFIVRKHPSWIKEEISYNEIRAILEKIIEEKEFDKTKFEEKVITSIACHSSVKAGDYLSTEDETWIINNLRKCENPFTCPHGRPTIISYTKEEIEKSFKRDYNE